jgi:hypothetical protein
MIFPDSFDPHAVTEVWLNYAYTGIRDWEQVEERVRALFPSAEIKGYAQHEELDLLILGMVPESVLPREYFAPLENELARDPSNRPHGE